VGLLTLTGVVAPGLQLLAAPVLFLAGAFLGAVHGALLAIVGRPRHVRPAPALRSALCALLVAVPALLPAWFVTMAISLSAALAREWRLSWAILALAGWLLGLAVCAWALSEVWRALVRAWARWPESRAGSVLTALVFLGACALSIGVRPELWGTGLRVNGVGAFIVALAATLWIGFPLVWVTLRLLTDHRLHSPVGGHEAGAP
jgi:hypothetical protein